MPETLSTASDMEPKMFFASRRNHSRKSNIPLASELAIRFAVLNY
jgi:hypothetical protein